MSGSGSVGARLTPQQLDELRAIDSPTIANAIEEFKVRPRVNGYAGATLRCLIPGLGTMLGYAVTCKGDSTTEGKQRREHTELYRAINALQPLPAVVVIGDDGDPGRIDLSCHAGEMMATTMKRVGAVGLVTDGGLRDIKEVTALGGFHYFGRGLVVAHGQPCIYDVGATVTICRAWRCARGTCCTGTRTGSPSSRRRSPRRWWPRPWRCGSTSKGACKEILGPDFHRQFELATRYQ